MQMGSPVFGLFGLLVIAPMAWIVFTFVRDLWFWHRLSTTGHEASGLVVEVEERRTRGKNGSSTRLIETIEFLTADGVAVRGTPVAAAPGDPKNDRIGQSVPLRYDPTLPTRFIAPLGDPTKPPLTVVMKAVMGVIVLLIGWNIIRPLQSVLALFGG